MQLIETPEPHRFCVAPMLDWTTPECRALHRLFTRRAFLYTEMVTTGALIYGDAARHLQHQADAPCALQLGGGEPEALARACEIALSYGYQEINLNVGCPSDRVQNNRIGACLMDDAPLVAECLSAMQQTAGTVPVTVKHRLAIDEQDERDVLNFVETVANRRPCRIFIINARKAWLQGLSPKARPRRLPEPGAAARRRHALRRCRANAQRRAATNPRAHRRASRTGRTAQPLHPPPAGTISRCTRCQTLPPHFERSIDIFDRALAAVAHP